MTETDFQGGAYFEVFNAQNKDSQCFLRCSTNKPGDSETLNREFDTTLRSFVFSIKSISTKCYVYKNDKQLQLFQRYIVFQMMIPSNKDLLLEFGVHDMTGARRRIMLSTQIRGINIEPLVTRLPLGVVRHDQWMNLVLDMASLVRESWKGQSFQCVHSVSVAGTCRVRRVFTMRAQLQDNSSDHERYGCKGTNEDVDLDSLPPKYAAAAIHLTQVLNFTKLQHYVSYVSSILPVATVENPDIHASGDGRQRADRGSHRRCPSSQTRSGRGTAESRGGTGKPPDAGAGEAGPHDAESNQDGAVQTPRARGHGGRRQKAASDVESWSQGEQSSRENSGKARAQGRSRASRPPVIAARQEGSSRDNSTAGGGQSIEQSTGDSRVRRADNSQHHALANGGARHTHHHARSKSDTASLEVLDRDSSRESAYVHPHPPSEPSSAKHRRPRPVRSAGSERSSHLNKGGEAVMPTAVATDAEEAAIMAAMQQSHRRHHQYAPGSTTTSEENSMAGEDDVAHAIHLLNTRTPPRLHSDTSEPTTGHEADDTEEEEAGPNQVYSFSSRPRDISHNAENHRRRGFTNKKHGSRRRQSGEREATVEYNSMRRIVKRRPSSEQRRAVARGEGREQERRLGSGGAVKPRGSTSLESETTASPSEKSLPSSASSDQHDAAPLRNSHRKVPARRAEKLDQTRANRRPFVPQLNAPSSEEEPHLSVSQCRQHALSRLEPGTPRSQQGSSPRRHHRSPRHHHKARHAQRTPRVARPHSPGAHSEDDSSHAPLSISRKSLREIPGPTDSPRQSGWHKVYNPEHYQNGPGTQLVSGFGEGTMEFEKHGGATFNFDGTGATLALQLHDSLEAQFLQKVRSGEVLSDEDSESASERAWQGAPTPPEQRASSRFRYRNDSHSSDNEQEFGTSSTLKNMTQRDTYNYQDEVELMKSQGDELLTVSNPRSVNELCSPPIPKTSLKSQENLHSHHEPAVARPEASAREGAARRAGGALTARGDGRPGEQELELYYDPVLNCYYDPKTYKYYELV